MCFMPHKIFILFQKENEKAGCACASFCINMHFFQNFT